jgi:uncharacterized membrane protein
MNSLENMNLNTIGVFLAIAVIVAGATQLLKYYFPEIDPKNYTLILGLGLGVVAMFITGGQFGEYVLIGLGGALASNGLYDQLAKRFKGVDNND